MTVSSAIRLSRHNISYFYIRFRVHAAIAMPMVRQSERALAPADAESIVRGLFRQGGYSERQVPMASSSAITAGACRSGLPRHPIHHGKDALHQDRACMARMQLARAEHSASSGL